MLKNVRKTRRKYFNCFQQAMQNIILLFFLFKLISRAQNCWQKEEEYYCLPLFEINLAIKHYAAPLTPVVIALMVPTDVRHTYICIYSIPIRKLAHIRTAKPNELLPFIIISNLCQMSRNPFTGSLTHTHTYSHTHPRTLPHADTHWGTHTMAIIAWQLQIWLPFSVAAFRNCFGFWFQYYLKHFIFIFIFLFFCFHT